MFHQFHEGFGSQDRIGQAFEQGFHRTEWNSARQGEPVGGELVRYFVFPVVRMGTVRIRLQAGGLFLRGFVVAFEGGSSKHGQQGFEELATGESMGGRSDVPDFGSYRFDASLLFLLRVARDPGSCGGDLQAFQLVPS